MANEISVDGDVEVIELYKIGCTILIDENIEAIITGICIKGNYHITYECTWWDGKTRKCEWLEETEIKLHDKTKLSKIGFFVPNL